MKPDCVVLGGGGHAKMVLETLACEGKHRPVGLTDLQTSPRKVLGVRVLGDDGILPDLRKKGIRWFVVGLGSISDNRPRAMLYRKGCAAGLEGLWTIHPSATVAKSATIGSGTVILPRAVVNPESLVGVNVILNTASVVEHDVRIADHAHVCPGAVLCGGVQVEEGAFIGAGAVVRQGVRIGAWSVVGAGSLVLSDVAAGKRVAGVPCRPLARKRR